IANRYGVEYYDVGKVGAREGYASDLVARLQYKNLAKNGKLAKDGKIDWRFIEAEDMKYRVPDGQPDVSRGDNPFESLTGIEMNPERSLGLSIREEPFQVRQTNGVMSTEYLHYLCMFDFQSGTFLDICEGVSPEEPVKFIGSNHVAFVANRHAHQLDRRENPPDRQIPDVNSQPVRVVEIWSVRGGAKRIAQIEDLSTEWMPSFAHFPDRNAIIGVLDASKLTTLHAETGEVVQEVELRFDVAPGPDALKRLEDGRLAVRDANGPVHFIDPINWAQSSSEAWAPKPRSQTRALWDGSGRYVALSSPDIMTATRADEFRKQWYVVHVESGDTVATLPMPMTEPIQIYRRPGKRSSKKWELIFVSEALPIVQLEVVKGGESISILDNRGGVWTWVRSPNVGITKRELPLMRSIRLAKRDQDHVVATDGVDVQYVRISEMSRPRTLKRLRGGRVVAIAVDGVAEKICLLDEDGYLSIFDSGRRRPDEPRILDAVDVTLARRGAIAGVSTRRGTLVFIDAKNGKIIRESQAHNGAVTGLTYLASTRVIISTGDDMTVRMFDPLSGTRIPADEVFLSKPAFRLSPAPEENRLIACSRELVTVLEISDSQITQAIPPAIGDEVQFASTFDGGRRLLVCGKRSRTIFDGATGQRLYSLPQTTVDICDIMEVDGDPWFLLADSTSVRFSANRED
ncbi:MAG: hypothetical protein AAGJ83_10000, partial [Planctomycetota bacterium]